MKQFPSVTKEAVDQLAASATKTFTVLPDGKTTICQLTFWGGLYSVDGHSACVDPRNFDKAEGEKWAEKAAVEKLWQVLGVKLAAELHADNTAVMQVANMVSEDLANGITTYLHSLRQHVALATQQLEQTTLEMKSRSFPTMSRAYQEMVRGKAKAWADVKWFVEQDILFYQGAHPSQGFAAQPQEAEAKDGATETQPAAAPTPAPTEEAKRVGMLKVDGMFIPWNQEENALFRANSSVRAIMLGMVKSLPGVPLLVLKRAMGTEGGQGMWFEREPVYYAGELRKVPPDHQNPYGETHAKVTCVLGTSVRWVDFEDLYLRS